MLYFQYSLCLTFGLFDHTLFLCLCFEDCSLFLSFCIQNCGFFFTFCNKDRRFLLTFCTKDSFSSFTLCFHLFFHGFLNSSRRNDVFEFYPVDFDSPWICGNIQRCTHFCVDYFTGSQCFIKFHITNDISQCCRRQIFDCHDRVLNSVCKKLRICDLEKYNRIDLHGYVIFCDNRLWWEVHYLLFQIYSSRYTVNKWCLEVNTCVPCFFVSTKTFYNDCICLWHNADTGCQYPECENYQHDKNNNSCHFTYPPFLLLQSVLLPEHLQL